jgi:hypothetical protein
MNTKQKQFVAEYVVDHNATKAAVRAGYAPARGKQTGYRLLQMPDVVHAVEKLDADRRERLGVSADWIVDQLATIVEESMSGRPRTNPLGELILDVRTDRPIVDTDYTNANRALQTLSKIAGLQVRRTESVSTSEVRVVTLNFDRDLAAT